MATWVTLLPYHKKVLGIISVLSAKNSLFFLCGFPLGIPVFFHVPKTCLGGELENSFM